MPSAYDAKKRYPFRPIQLRFLHGLASGAPVEEICQKLEITVEYAVRLLKQKKCQEYLAELDTMEAGAVARLSANRLATELVEVWDGKKVKNREQMEAWKELAARGWPKPDKTAGGTGEKLEININLNKVQEAFTRQDAIEAEVIPKDAA